MVQKIDVVPVQNHPLFSIYFVRFFTQRSFSKIIFSVNLCSTKKDSFLKNVPENRYFSSLNDPSRVSSLKKKTMSISIQVGLTIPSNQDILHILERW